MAIELQVFVLVRVTMNVLLAGASVYSYMIICNRTCFNVNAALESSVSVGAAAADAVAIGND